MNKTLLVADDDKAFHRLISRAFEGTGWKVEAADDGMKALERLSDTPPDVILLDLNMPRLDGRELLARIRGNPRLAMIPVIIVSGSDSPVEKASQFGMGADDFISKPFDSVELISRVEGVSKRNRLILAANPLTFLPGGPAIEEEAARRIKSGCDLAFFYLDLDNFKVYNDNYGYLNGDNVIKCVAGLLSDLRNDFEAEDVFLGHIGGDDFVLMAGFRGAEDIARAVTAGFDAIAPGFYGAEDRARGYLFSRDRLGIGRKFPLMTLSAAIATNERRRLDHYAKIVDIVSEIKKYLKGLKGRSGSLFLKDRRRD
ncbi:MAG: diguanylate cyclase response regulator [Elusimicrobia bacterium CG08_land_8_20_14_0_20_59_10]|nr:MAG: diguanylate cyclase response regulator [Elusimicrobia bacterium CG08_land_8_20_14_0_20_59_10]